MNLEILLVVAKFLIAALWKNKNINDSYVAFNVLWIDVAVLINDGGKYVILEKIWNTISATVSLTGRRGAIA